MNTWERVGEIFQGNQSAVELMKIVKVISHVWDDLVDGEAVSLNQLNSAFWLALVGLRRNEFYREHYALLDPILDGACLNYVASIVLEKGTEQQREIAHNARYAVGDIALTIAGIIGGYAWAAKHSAELKAMSNTDTMAHFKAEMNERHGHAAH